MTRREQIAFQIHQGDLRMPTITKLKKQVSKETYKQIEAMFNAMWFHYLKNGKESTVSLPYWSKRIKNQRAINFALKSLALNGWIKSVSVPGNNWGEAYLLESKLLEYVDQDTLDHIRMHKKFNKYMLTNASELVHSSEWSWDSLVQNGTKMQSKAYRPGFTKAGMTQFKFDTVIMKKYQNEVIHLINKGIEKSIEKYPDITKDHANYREIGQEIVENYIYEDGTYISGERAGDSRGRDIAGYLDKIGNPVQFKIMRAMLVIPKEFRNTATLSGLYNKYMFIAELLGWKEGTKQDKINFGRDAYYTRKLNNSDDLDEFYEDVWLERLYNDIDGFIGTSIKPNIIKKRYQNQEITLDKARRQLESEVKLYKWQVVIEIDMSASVLGFMGILLSHQPFLDRCNITHGTLTDAWGHDVITNRKQFKTIMRQAYGSQLSASEMWKAMKIPYTAEEVQAFDHEMAEGDISVAIRFKDFIISNCNPKPEMTLSICNEDITVKCNRHHNVGEKTTAFDLYDSDSKSIRRIHNTSIKQVPDLNRFRKYMVTAIIHRLDNQVIDQSVEAVYDAYGWVLPIHDAMILCCEAADYGRETYCYGQNKESISLKYIHDNRNQILSEYFTSIGIKPSAIRKWEEDVKPYIIPLEEPLDINPMVLK